jgi:hypothetical protein
MSNETSLNLVNDETSITISGVQIQLASSVNPDRLTYFSAPNPAQNSTIRQAVRLATALVQIPKFSGVMAFVLPGTFIAGPLPENAMELSIAIKEGFGADDPCFIHFMFADGTRTIMNVGLLLKAFSHGWRNGLQTILLENFMDGRDPALFLTAETEVLQVLLAKAQSLFGEFEEPKPEVDPFAIPTGLSPAQLPGGGGNNEGE